MEPDFWNFGEGAGGDVAPAVDPRDLQAVWKLFRDEQNRDPRAKAIGLERIRQVCSEGADPRAVSYRCMVLGMLDNICSLILQHAGAAGQGDASGTLEQGRNKWLSFRRQNGDLEEAALKVAATFPMKKMQGGVVSNDLPFDVGEFLKQIEAAK